MSIYNELEYINEIHTLEDELDYARSILDSNNITVDTINTDIADASETYIEDLHATVSNAQNSLCKIVSELYTLNKETLEDRDAKLVRFRDAEGAPIFSRTRTEYEKAVIKIDTALHCDFFSEICRDKSGFIAGKNPTYSINNDTNDANSDFLIDWINQINLPKIEMQTTLLSAICGTAYRYLWYDQVHDVTTDSVAYDVYIEMMDPAEVFHIESRNNRIAIRVYTTNSGTFVELYTAKNKHRFSARDTSNDIISNSQLVDANSGTEDLTITLQLTYLNTVPHAFGYCNVIPYRNDEYMMGDCDKSLTLMDSYNRIVSDFSNEIEQFRASYIKATGCRLPETKAERQELTDNMEKTGIIALEGSGNIDWLIKNLDFPGIISWLDKTEDQIYRGSSAVNYNSQNFGGQITGVALMHRMQQMKNKCLVTIREFQGSNNEMFKAITSLWNTFNIATINYRDIKVKYNLSLPVDLESEANVATKLKGIISDKTLLTLTSFGVIENVEDELKQIELEAKQKKAITNSNDSENNV